jgi:hypothetical protein
VIKEQARGRKKLKRARIDGNQWQAILNDLGAAVSKLGYFKRTIGLDELVRSNLSWTCADASLFLNEVEKHGRWEPDAARTVGVSLRDDVLIRWCKRFYAGPEPIYNESLTDARGFYESTGLLIEPEGPMVSLSRQLHSHLHAFLLDHNLSFEYEGSHEGSSTWKWDAAEHKNAFRRFAANLERTVIRYDTPLSDDMRGLQI